MMSGSNLFHSNHHYLYNNKKSAKRKQTLHPGKHFDEEGKQQSSWNKLKVYEKVAAMTALGQIGGIVVSGLEINKLFREWTGFEGGTVLSIEPLFLCDIENPIPTPLSSMSDLKERLEKC
jgi:hypothetical protein